MIRKDGNYEVRINDSRSFIALYSNDYNGWRVFNERGVVSDDALTVVNSTEIFDQLEEASRMRELLKDIYNNSDTQDESEVNAEIKDLLNRVKEFIK